MVVYARVESYNNLSKSQSPVKCNARKSSPMVKASPGSSAREDLENLKIKSATSPFDDVFIEMGLHVDRLRAMKRRFSSQFN